MGKSFAEPALLDRYVRAFEEALASGVEPDLRAYLPEPGDPLYREVLSELVRIDLEASWEKGRPRPLAEYRLRMPEAFERAEEVEALAFEEYRLRRQAGEDPSPEEYESAYGISTEGWPRPRGAAAPSAWFSRPSGGGAGPRGTWTPRDTGTLYHSCSGSAFHDRLLRDLCLAGLPSTVPGGRPAGEMPEVGTGFLGFRLLEELGRGAFGRVFLAEQPSLANRKVALKVTVEGGESQTLAQLQHTHIVPVYSNHQDGPLHAVCMPYLGPVTLADVLAELGGAPRRAGGELLEALAACLGKKGKEAEGPGVPEVTRKRLQGMEFAEAVTWLGACLADGLAHAHERGILHRDLKPANVLLADEGVPMLLDFNLAEDVKLPGGGAGQVGGTLAYMAPEHLRAFGGDAAPGGTPGPPGRADERSDLFSLGMVLFELLTGRSPFPAPVRSPTPSDPDGVGGLLDAMIRDRSGPPPSAWAVNRAVPPALDAILRRCLEPDPARRYASARQLREDLQCQLDALPLRHTREPSLRERVGKLFRRSPRLLGRLVASAALVAVALSLWVGQRAWSQKREEQARRERLAQAQDTLSSLERTHKEYRQAAFLLDPRDTPEWRAKGRAVCAGILKRYGVLARDDWQQGPRVALLSGPTRERLLGEIGEVLLLSAEEAADGAGSGPAGLREAMELNERAEGCFAPVPAVVYLQRAELLDRLGRTAEAGRARKEAEALKPRTARDRYLLGRERLRERRLKEARDLLEEATWLDPTSVRAWFLKGVCCDLLYDDDAALGCYDVCVAAAGDFPGAYFNRGTAHLRKKSYKQAEADFTRVLALQPADQDAHVNRALARRGLKDYPGALADLDKALELDGSVTRLYFLRSRVRARAGDEAGAKADFEEGLRRKPTDVKSWSALGSAYLSRRDYRAALEAFEEALKLNPNSRADLANKSHVLAERLGKTEEALPVQERLVRLYPDHAPARSGRGVLLARLGRREEALSDAAEVLARTRSPDLVYQVGCIYALTSRQQPEDAGRAFNLLHDALRRGFGAQYLPTDPDLAPLRGRQEFGRLEALARELRSPPAPETPGGTPGPQRGEK